MEQGESRNQGPFAIERLDTARNGWPGMSAERDTATTWKLSVVMAAHNEVRTIAEAISSVLRLDAHFDLELIVVDDGSDDGTDEVIRSFSDRRLVGLRREVRRGKGAALLSAATVATGTHLLVYDADLEYSADDIPALFEPVRRGEAAVVYGTRVPGFRTAFRSFRYALGSKVTTAAANLLFDAWLTDMHTCLKLVPLRLFRELTLGEAGFGLDTEITAELLRRGIRPYEVPCSYRGRSVAEGKKISARDGMGCLAVLLRVRLRGLVPYELEACDGLKVVTGTRQDRTLGVVTDLLPGDPGELAFEETLPLAERGPNEVELATSRRAGAGWVQVR